MKSIKLNSVNKLEQFKESINKTIDKEIAKKKLDEKINSLDNLSFVECKNIFESISDKLFDSNSEYIAKYVKTIKENKDLKTLYLLSESILKPSLTNDANLLVTSISNISEGLNKKSIKKGINKLNSIVKEALKSVNIEDSFIDEVLSNNKELNESLTFVLTNNKTTKNLFEHTNCMHNLVTHINENMNQINDSNNKSTNELISDLNEAISCENEWETEAIRDLSLCYLSESSKEDLFNKYKNDCISLLESKIDNSKSIDESSRFTSMKNQLTNKVYDENKLQESILKLSELKYTLNEE